MPLRRPGSATNVSRTILFVFVGLCGLAALTSVAAAIARKVTGRWFDNDIRLRSELAVRGARHALLAAVGSSGFGPLSTALGEIANDERIIAVAACSTERTLLARTAEFPREIACERFPPRPSHQGPVTARINLPDGPVRVDVISLLDAPPPLGPILVVHDLKYIDEREREAAIFLTVLFGAVAIIGTTLIVLGARLSRTAIRKEMERALREKRVERELELLVDVAQNDGLLPADREAEPGDHSWGAGRLRATLERSFPDEKVIILANREPYIHHRNTDGEIAVLHPASGVVTALEPVLRACSGTWVAHGSGSADRETADAAGRLSVPPGEDAYTLRRVWLSRAEEKGYYYGLANEGLWPLCHIAHTRPAFRGEDWAQYKLVNQKFADAVCEEASADDPLVLVQDYHFALAPQFIRQRLPRATIITFWHIPWPNSERFGICPWREELIEGLLGSSILGFHTQLHCNNFIEAVDRYMESRIDREQSAIVHNGRGTFVRPYPISIEWPTAWARTAPPIEECRSQVRSELGLPPDALLGVGVDRLDYTKGIEERLLAVERLLLDHPEYLGRFSFIQLAAPSRTEIGQYRELNTRVEALAAQINERLGNDRYRPVILLRAHHEPPTVLRFYRAADLCYVSSLHDGMNLVAKEFVAAREDDGGVLVLSQFTGAARELPEALVVNPYDLENASAALARALAMPRPERSERMRAMRAHVAEFNVHRWAGRMLVDASRLRRRERFRHCIGVPLT